MTNRQQEILTAIHQGKNLPTDICEATNRGKQDVSGILVKLLDTGYVTASFDPMDARRRVYNLTTAGKNALEQV
jgi:DNA-binding MarR family transcriptional regulator